MASIIISPENNMRTIVELAGGSMDQTTYAIDSLHVQDVSQEDLDAAFSTYNSDPETYLLGPAREGSKEEISFSAHAYISETYPSFRRELFIALAEEARNSGLTNRADYINQVLVWVKTIVVAVFAAEDMVDAAATIEEINSISLNTEIFNITNPNITIKAALAILD